MPLLDHLVELRKRLIYALVCFFLVFFITFYFAKPIFSFLIQPALADGYKVVVLDIFEFFFVTVKLSAFVALIVGFPLIAVQIWLFVAPGLYRHEKRAFVPFLVATPFMFYAGCALMYYVVLPYVINFMLTQYAPPDIEKTLRSSDYLERILQLVFAFGFAFEVPVLLTLLIQVGIATTEGLRSKRRYAIVVARFNDLITERLLAGALDVLGRSGVDTAAVAVAWVPGAFEIPLVAQKLGETGRYDAVIALGRFGKVTGDSLSAAQADLQTNLVQLQRPLKQIGRSSPYFLDAMRLIITNPYPLDNIPKVIRGDYLNLSLNVDLTLSSIDNGLLTGTGFQGMLRALEQSWGRDPQTMIPDVRYTPHPNMTDGGGPFVERGE